MSKIEWTTQSYITVGKHKIPCDPDIKDGYHQGSGIKKVSRIKSSVKSIVWPAFNLRNKLLIDGFIGAEIGKLIKRYIQPDSTFLEIGCGDMSLSKFVDPPQWYNGLDLELTEFHIKRNYNYKSNLNIVLASAAQIPAKDSIADLLVSTETLEHIPEIDQSVQEIHRLAKNKAIFICSIPNNYCHKYIKKGPHQGHINNWTYDEFINYMGEYGFELVEGFMKGVWIPLPMWLTKASYQVPLSTSQEYYNTNFFYVFRVKK